MTILLTGQLVMSNVWQWDRYRVPQNVFLFIYLFIYLSARLRENGWTDLHEIFREGVVWPRPDSILGQFGETARCRDANFFVSICQHHSAIGSSGTPVLPFSDRECNELCYIATRGRGLLCFRTTACWQLFCTVWKPECWTLTEDVRGSDGASHNLTTLDECRAACISDDSCVAIDWETSSSGTICWILTSTATTGTATSGVITHYELDRACLG